MALLENGHLFNFQNRRNIPCVQPIYPDNPKLNLQRFMELQPAFRGGVIVLKNKEGISVHRYGNEFPDGAISLRTISEESFEERLAIQHKLITDCHAHKHPSRVIKRGVPDNLRVKDIAFTRYVYRNNEAEETIAEQLPLYHFLDASVPEDTPIVVISDRFFVNLTPNGSVQTSSYKDSIHTLQEAWGAWFVFSQFDGEKTVDFPPSDRKSSEEILP